MMIKWDFMAILAMRLKRRAFYLANRLLSRFGYQIVTSAAHEDYLSQLAHPTRDRVQPDSLLWYSGDVYSDRGQDGVLREIFSRIGLHTGTFVEFGAWDGVYISNSRFLFEKGWSGVFIEADPKRFAVLQKNYASAADRITCIQAMVTATRPLGEVLRTHAPNLRPDFVGIDIDGLDLDVAIASELYAMGVKVLLIEGGYTFDPRLEERVPDSVASDWAGQPIAVMVKALRDEGFEPVCFFQDLYLVRKEFAYLFKVIKRDPVSLFEDAFWWAGERHVALLMQSRNRIGAPAIEAARGLVFPYRKDA
jgi:hypothetical protein